MCIRDHGGTLCWAVTFVNQISGEDVEPKVVVTSDHVSVFDIADLCLDADSDRQFRVLDARGKVLKQWTFTQYDAAQLSQFIQQVASARLLDLYNYAWKGADVKDAAARTAPISQLGQDLWVLQVLNKKRGGFFVDIGAGDGVEISNSLRLERDFGWNGIAIEPSRQFEALQRNRKCCCLKECVGETEEEVVFLEDYLHGEHNHFSGMVKYADCHPQKGTEVHMTSRPLASLLRAQDVPNGVIDFLSLDTEGSELAILRAFPFSDYTIKAIAVEHNFVEPRRTEMRTLLESNGFKHIALSVSQWDDWYLHKTEL